RDEQHLARASRRGRSDWSALNALPSCTAVTAPSGLEGSSPLLHPPSYQASITILPDKPSKRDKTFHSNSIDISVASSRPARTSFIRRSLRSRALTYSRHSVELARVSSGLSTKKCEIVATHPFAKTSSSIRLFRNSLNLCSLAAFTIRNSPSLSVFAFSRSKGDPLAKASFINAIYDFLSSPFVSLRNTYSSSFSITTFPVYSMDETSTAT